MEKVFQFKTPKKAAKIKVDPKKIQKPQKLTVELPRYIQGVEAQSKQEQRVAWALSKLKLEYYFQYVIDYGRARRGGQVIDFMVFTLPLWTAVYVQGDYWHGDSQAINRDRLKMRSLMLAMRGKIKEPVELWEHELQDAEMALETVRRKIL